MKRAHMLTMLAATAAIALMAYAVPVMVDTDVHAPPAIVAASTAPASLPAADYQNAIFVTTSGAPSAFSVQTCAIPFSPSPSRDHSMFCIPAATGQITDAQTYSTHTTTTALYDPGAEFATARAATANHYTYTDGVMTLMTTGVPAGGDADMASIRPATLAIFANLTTAHGGHPVIHDSSGAGIGVSTIGRGI